MNNLYPFCTDINLHVRGRVSAEDATRQEQTAREILRRMMTQPGLILADEVGMGKTFVALSVAISVALANRGKRPVVVMVPSALKEKWPADFALFCEKCLPDHVASKIQCGQAERAVEFLKLLDAPPERRKSIIFLTHGAMSRGLNDPWVMLAIVQQSLYRRRNIQSLRSAIYRNLGDLLPQLKWAQKRDPDIWERLLRTPSDRWLTILQSIGLEEDDDPIPAAVAKVLPLLDTDSVFEAIQQIPLRKSQNYGSRILQARKEIKEQLRSTWRECLQIARLRLPLLILDEAHHLKNSETRLASLFRSAEASHDADEVSRGELAGAFERMLFLTATPFQLGHGELCSVLDRFDGISWNSSLAPTMGRDGFATQRTNLRMSLDSAQEAAVTLDHAWGRLRIEDLKMAEKSFECVESWWQQARQGGDLSLAAVDVRHCFERTGERMKEAEKQLQPWVIRHLKPRRFSAQHADIYRRRRLVGRSIATDDHMDGEMGIEVNGEALLPFLLAARASSCTPDARPVFAEGLASSYETFLHTRKNNGANSTDGDDDQIQEMDVHDAAHWYLDHLESLIPRNTNTETHHPKIAATVQRVVDIWRRGEKSVVFCHYVVTGRVLRQKISNAIQAEICRLGAEKLNIPVDQVPRQLDLIGRRFFDEDSPIRQACDALVEELISQHAELSEFQDDLVEIIRRNVRTPSFLVRFFPLDRDRLDADAMRHALETRDLSNLTLRQILQQFLVFLVERCGSFDRKRYIEAVKKIQTGSHFGVQVAQEYEDDELQGTHPDQLLPNVRLVNGTTRSETRQRLMLTFNTPFYPEVLIASSVMAEGVDLHLNCRYILHHDLCWNPSTLEQRTGRVDRIGAKAELAGQPIHIYIPFIAETQDEKMYRVVMDRERWFNIVMSEDYKVDMRTTEKLADRIPFPESAANELSFRLNVD